MADKIKYPIESDLTRREIDLKRALLSSKNLKGSSNHAPASFDQNSSNFPRSKAFSTRVNFNSENSNHEHRNSNRVRDYSEEKLNTRDDSRERFRDLYKPRKRDDSYDSNSANDSKHYSKKTRELPIRSRSRSRSKDSYKYKNESRDKFRDYSKNEKRNISRDRYRNPSKDGLRNRDSSIDNFKRNDIRIKNQDLSPSENIYRNDLSSDYSKSRNRQRDGSENHSTSLKKNRHRSQSVDISEENNEKGENHKSYQSAVHKNRTSDTSKERSYRGRNSNFSNKDSTRNYRSRSRDDDRIRSRRQYSRERQDDDRTRNRHQYSRDRQDENRGNPRLQISGDRRDGDSIYKNEDGTRQDQETDKYSRENRGGGSYNKGRNNGYDQGFLEHRRSLRESKFAFVYAQSPTWSEEEDLAKKEKSVLKECLKKLESKAKNNISDSEDEGKSRSSRKKKSHKKSKRKSHHDSKRRKSKRSKKRYSSSSDVSSSSSSSISETDSERRSTKKKRSKKRYPSSSPSSSESEISKTKKNNKVSRDDEKTKGISQNKDSFKENVRSQYSTSDDEEIVEWVEKPAEKNLETSSYTTSHSSIPTKNAAENKDASEKSSTAFIGPEIPNTLDPHLDSKDFGMALLPGEGSAMAAYVQSGKRIPRRGEIGLKSEEISKFEDSGYVMSGSRHRRMNAVRLRKENQIISAEEKRQLLIFNQEERSKRESKIVSDFREILSSKFSDKK
ncbi:NF-kappa-B-activating protein [Smittium mucronatum]|uniref:NF-kappa-B-activating protein n=1 Tax=Smittium mucronatum TaxID=133383 RepID=A0A1R0GTP3_9FUNG|nr:NF-kappa-B-activating protein [Smittium mucronatum]